MARVIKVGHCMFGYCGANHKVAKFVKSSVVNDRKFRDRGAVGLDKLGHRMTVRSDNRGLGRVRNGFWKWEPG